MAKRILSFTLLLVILASVPSLAGTVYGTTGLFHTPNADVLPTGMIGASVHVADNQVIAALNYALMDFLELGVSSRSRGSSNTKFSAFLKAQIFEETSSDPGLAAGIEGGSAFVVLSKTLTPLLRGHMGIGTGRFSRLFGGVSYLVNPVVVSRSTNFQMPRIMVIAEYDGAGANVGTRLSFAQGLDVNIMLQDLDDLMIGAGWRTRF